MHAPATIYICTTDRQPITSEVNGEWGLIAAGSLQLGKHNQTHYSYSLILVPMYWSSSWSWQLAIGEVKLVDNYQLYLSIVILHVDDFEFFSPEESMRTKWGLLGRWGGGVITSDVCWLCGNCWGMRFIDTATPVRIPLLSKLLFQSWNLLAGLQCVLQRRNKETWDYDPLGIYVCITAARS